MPTLEQLFRRKPVPEMSAETGSDTGQSELTRSIGLFRLSMFGVGATIGTGIFFVLAQAVPVRSPRGATAAGAAPWSTA
jgi:basic amino acid/polyamine antiporter, APA family